MTLTDISIFVENLGGVLCKLQRHKIENKTLLALQGFRNSYYTKNNVCPCQELHVLKKARAGLISILQSWVHEEALWTSEIGFSPQSVSTVAAGIYFCKPLCIPGSYKNHFIQVVIESTHKVMVLIMKISLNLFTY